MRSRVAVLAVMSTLAIGTLYAQVFNKKTERRAGETDYEITDVSDQVPELKKQARTSLTPFRYDASKVTYFVYKTFQQRKEVEVFFFNGNDYQIAFNPGAVDNALELEIWDKPQTYANKTLLYKKSGVKGGIFPVQSTELRQALIDKKVEAGMPAQEAEKLQLKKVYVNYIIPAKAKETKTGDEGQTVVVRTKGAMVMAMGYKNV